LNGSGTSESLMTAALRRRATPAHGNDQLGAADKPIGVLSGKSLPLILIKLPALRGNHHLALRGAWDEASMRIDVGGLRSRSSVAVVCIGKRQAEKAASR
jgi:hypothetical protein